ncbi:Concanavalin A-like lectin/glucanases superfamily protein [Amycolatopsis pretoriensis]|uniref:Concanavalin A-like lectin/glucanases superfamily protein n=1 Tax=Amycolatopsis pretoriensis TaxID=218821 RepID=A0A1H5QMZ6_9PSEU|nr:Concanavalin A-like lectin/glucanases superfamily protein [Amycolatopsis pretoriensis]
MLFLVLAVAFGILPATAFLRPPAAAADTVAQVPDTAPDEATAARYAEQARKRVQVVDQTTETAETFANPDGTLTTTRHTRPVRVKRGTGWSAPDSTLAPKDGVLAPNAATTGITLSAGAKSAAKSVGAQPLLRLTRDGTTAGFDWLGALPEPVVTGSTATYPEVLPGADLRVEVDIDTVHEVVVVKTPEAAKNLAKLEFGVPVRGGTVTKDADGSLHVRNAAGDEKFTAPAATMWDSSGVETATHDFTRGPASAGRRAVVGVDLAGTKLTLTPDPKLLAAADTVYPVYVDPTWHDNYCGACGRNHYLVQYACGTGKTPGDAVWDSDDSLKAGYFNDPNSSCSQHLVTARSFVEMNLGGLAGKKIYGASLNLSLPNPGDCSKTNNVVWAGGISAGLKFNSGPAWWNTVGVVGGNCTGDTHSAGFDITGTIDSAVKGNSPTWTFGIVSPDENNQATWKRYSPQVGFSVIYNSPPNQPKNLAIFNGTQSYPCVQGASRPVLGPTATGYVTRANVSDPDGYALDARFRVYKGLVSKGGYTWTGRDYGSDNIVSDTNQANRNAAATLPKTEMNADGFYSWDVHSTDGKDEAWAVPCEVEIELTAPAVPGVASQTYPSGAYGGGPGRPGDFTFTAAGTAAPVDHYVWKLDNTAAPSCNGTEAGTVKPKVLNGPGTTAIAPGSSGPHVLSAWSCNRAKTPSNRVDYGFTVKDAAAPVASWQFEGDGRSQVTGLRYAGAGTGNFTAGKLGQAAALSGQAGDYFATPARIVDTAKSFSVSTWVNAADLNGQRAVLSQDGDQASGFALQYLSGKWAFSLSGSDVANPVVTSAVSTVTPATGTWTHLTGVYDATAHTAALYVDGALQQTVSATAANVTGPLVLGGGKWGGVRTYLTKGSIDEAAVFGRALSAAEVTTMYGANGVPAGLGAVREYTLDGDAQDATGTENTLTLKNISYGQGYSDSAGQSATEDTTGHGSGQGLVDQGPGYATTSAPVVDSSQSFSISAWVKPTDANFYTLAAQMGTKGNAFQLSMSDLNIGLGMSTSDSADPAAAGWRWATAPVASHAGVWTHVTGTYDAVAGKERFYIDGALTGEVTIAAGTTWRGTGPFTVGKVADQDLGVYKGSIDQVQVWDRALPAAEVAGLANTAVLRANYQLDGTTTDSVTGVAGTPSGNVQLTADEDGANVARFPFEWGSQIEGPRPQNFRSDRSFTVEAWVKKTWTAEDAAKEKQRDSTDPAGVDKPGRTALGANGAYYSPYLLGYRGVQDASGAWHPRWSWAMWAKESTPTTPVSVLVAPDVDAQPNVWTHLAGTYDAVTHKACLYATTDAYQYSPKCVDNVVGWNGASDLEDLFLGRGRFKGMDTDYWYGDLRGIRVYSGVLDQQHINADTVVDHP